jgi:hypothetical protein
MDSVVLVLYDNLNYHIFISQKRRILSKCMVVWLLMYHYMTQQAHLFMNVYHRSPSILTPSQWLLIDPYICVTLIFYLLLSCSEIGHNTNSYTTIILSFLSLFVDLTAFLYAMLLLFNASVVCLDISVVYLVCVLCVCVCWWN